MAEQGGQWVSKGGVIDVSADGKTLAGHAFVAQACGSYACETRLETAAVRGFEFTIGTIDILLDGEKAELPALPEQDRIEVELALHTAALSSVAHRLIDARRNGEAPFPPNAMADWG